MSRLRIRKHIAPFIALVFSFVFAANSLAQSNETKWTRYESDDGSFSISFPPNSLIDKEKGKSGRDLRISGYGNNVSMELVAINMRGRPILSGMPEIDGSKSTKYEVDGFTILRYPAVTLPRIAEKVVVLGNQMLYFISYSAISGTEPELAQFIKSLRIKGKPVTAGSSVGDEAETTVRFDKLTTSSAVMDAWERDPGGVDLIVTREINIVGQADKPVAGMTRRAVIIDRPPPQTGVRSELESVLRNQGFWSRLRVKLLANGQVGGIVVLVETDKRFERDCVKAARRLRFVPAQINGVNADSEEIIEYFGTTAALPSVRRS